MAKGSIRAGSWVVISLSGVYKQGSYTYKILRIATHEPPSGGSEQRVGNVPLLSPHYFIRM